MPAEGSVECLSHLRVLFTDKLLLSVHLCKAELGISGYFVGFIWAKIKMSAEETEKPAAAAVAAAAEAPAGDEEEEWLYGGEALFHLSLSASLIIYRYLLSNTYYNHFINHISITN